MGLFSRKPRIADQEWAAALEAVPIVRRLDQAAREQLRSHAERFLRRTQFRFAADVEPDGRARLLIALQACLPVLNLGVSRLSRVATVLLVRTEYETETTEVDEAGVVHEGTDVAAGQFSELGTIVLSLADLRASGLGTGYNVIVHEVAHVLDLAGGDLDGAPPLHREMEPDEWTAAFDAAYRRVQRGALAGARGASAAPGLSRGGFRIGVSAGSTRRSGPVPDTGRGSGGGRGGGKAGVKGGRTRGSRHDDRRGNRDERRHGARDRRGYHGAPEPGRRRGRATPRVAANGPQPLARELQRPYRRDPGSRSAATAARPKRRSIVDPYAAEAPEELFAVMSELFFERPARLRSEHPDLYRQLSLFYRQEPARAAPTIAST